jgi:hypothetical protein
VRAQFFLTVLNTKTHLQTASFEVNMYNLKSEKVGTLNLPSHLFGARVRPDILHKYVLWHLANKRQGTTRVRTTLISDGKAALCVKNEIMLTTVLLNNS